MKSILRALVCDGKPTQNAPPIALQSLALRDVPVTTAPPGAIAQDSAGALASQLLGSSLNMGLATLRPNL